MLKLAASGGNYVLDLEATPNALLGSTSIGSFYAVAVQNPTFANNGCTATATLYKVVSGSVTQIGSATAPRRRKSILPRSKPMLHRRR